MPVVGFAAAEDLGAVDVPGGQVGEGAAAVVLVLDAHGCPDAAGARVGWQRTRAWMLVFSSAEITKSSVRPAACRPSGGRRGRARGRPWSRSRGRGGRSTSGAARAGWRRRTASARSWCRRSRRRCPARRRSAPMSGHVQARQRHAGRGRQLAGQRLDGDDDLRGKDRGSAASGQLLEPGQAVLRRTVCATSTRSHGGCPGGRRSRRCRALRRP